MYRKLKMLFRDYEDDEDRFDTLLYDEKIYLDDVLQEDPICQNIFFNYDGTLELRLIEDGLIDQVYIIMAGPENLVFDLEKKLKKVVDFLEPQDVINVDKNADSRDLKIFSLELIAGVGQEDIFDQGLYELLKKYLRDEEEDIRHVALVACGYLTWKELLPLVQQVKSNDSSAEIREIAGDIEKGLLLIHS